MCLSNTEPVCYMAQTEQKPAGYSSHTHVTHTATPVYQVPVLGARC